MEPKDIVASKDEPIRPTIDWPALGQGAWRIGDDPSRQREEIAALRLGLELGMRLIDTAEMYGEGRSESLIGEALRGIARDQYLLTSKVYPHNAGGARLTQSCEGSLKRLRTDCIDLYLLHWRGTIPLEETVYGMEALVRAGKIRRWGVSNFDVDDMQQLWRTSGGSNCAANQVLYHLGSRGVEFSLLPWMRAHGVAAMAYCPLAQAGALQRELLTAPVLREVAQYSGVTAMQLLLAFAMRQPHLIAIPKSGRPEHVAENAKAAHIAVDPSDWARIDAAYPPPTHKVPLDVE